MNYFKLFNLPQEFQIDNKLLSKNFYKLQLQFHPDLFLNKPESEKITILEKSIEINKGYRILKNFLSRAIHLLFLKGFIFDKKTVSLENNNFLIKYFFLYEQLEEIKKNNFNKIQKNKFSKKLDLKIKKCKKQIEMLFADNNYEEISKLLQKLLFFNKMKENLIKE